MKSTTSRITVYDLRIDRVAVHVLFASDWITSIGSHTGVLVTETPPSSAANQNGKKNISLAIGKTELDRKTKRFQTVLAHGASPKCVVKVILWQPCVVHISIPINSVSECFGAFKKILIHTESEIYSEKEISEIGLHLPVVSIWIS